jgi:hypothetical protein
MVFFFMILFASAGFGELPVDRNNANSNITEGSSEQHLLDGAEPGSPVGIPNETPIDVTARGSATGIPNESSPVHQLFYELFEQYREPTITDRFFKQADIEPLITALTNLPGFTVQREGESVEGRPIYLVKWGNGPQKVFLWSQMHGNEPTATMALMDIFRLLADPNPDSATAALRRQWSEELTLLFLPMVNPDGAERYQRRNALEVDLNRDAIRLSSPESRILKNVRDRYNADFGFNLHDQSVYYGAGEPENNPVAIAFLAPAFNAAKDTDAVRERAKRLTGALHRDLQSSIPGRIARYDDTFEPRAFGDNMQRWGTSTILIEAGGYADDPEKQYLRRLHFSMLLSAFTYIARGSYADAPLEDYLSIPMNRFNNVFSYLIRGGEVVVGGTRYPLDLAFRDQEILNRNATFDRFVPRLSEVGDMSIFGAYEQFDAEGFIIRHMQEFPEVFPSVQALLDYDWRRLLRQGYGYFRVYALDPDRELRRAAGHPFVVLTENQSAPDFPAIGSSVALVLEHPDGRKFIFANGQMIELGAGE